MDPVSDHKQLSGTDSLEMDCLGLNTAAIILVPSNDFSGRVVFKGKIGNSPWMPISESDELALDGQVPIDDDHLTLMKNGVTGLTQFGVFGEINSGTMDVYIGISEGVEVVQQVLSYTFVTMASDSHPLAVFTVDNPNPPAP